MITVYDHPEYDEPKNEELILEEDYLLQDDMGEVYEELYPRIPNEEFNFMQMMFQNHLDEMIREHEEERVSL